MTCLPLVTLLLIVPSVFSLQCYTFQTPAGSDLTTVQRTTVECPITARFCVMSFQQTVDAGGNAVLMENRGCSDDFMCHPFIKAQCTGCQGSGYGKVCCCMNNQCNERIY